MGALLGFVFVGLFSPGPNVILLTTSAARFGLRRTLPHLIGVVLGVGVTAGATGFGIGAALQARPGLELTLKILAFAWILYLAWQIWRAMPVGNAPAPDKQRPFGLIEAVLFQWVNPKIWAIAIAAAAGFTAELNPTEAATILAASFSAINLFVCLFWTFAGSVLGQLLKTPNAWRWFSRSMALGLAASAVMVFYAA